MPLLRLCLGALAGVALGQALGWDWRALLVLGVGLALAAAGSAKRGIEGSHRLLLVAAVFLGAARGASTASSSASPSYVGDGPHDVVCAVAEEPLRWGLRVGFACRVLEVDGQTVPASTVTVTTSRTVEVQYGDRLTVRGEVRWPRNRDRADYLRRCGMAGELQPDEVTLVSEGGWSARRALFALRRRAVEGLQVAVPQPEAAFLAGVTLGTEEGMPASAVDDLRRAGMLHLLVVSGANVAFLLGLVVTATRRALGWVWALLLAGLLAVGYALLTGGDPPVVRGAAMVLLALGAAAAGRPGHGWTALGLVGTVMAMVQPSLLRDVSYQLSMATSAGMLAVQRWGALRGMPHGWQRSLVETGAATIAAQMAAAPFLVAHFGQMPGVGLVSNLIAVPLQSLQMLLASAAVLAATVAPTEAQFIAAPAWLLARFTMTLARLAAQMPGASIALPSQTWPLVLAVVLATAVALGGRRWCKRLASLRRLVTLRSAWLLMGLALVVTAWAVALQLPDGRLHVTVLDVGQGDAILITTPSGGRVLVDGGRDPDVLAAHLGRALPFWQRHLDVLVLTHPDMDHMGGLFGLAPRYRVDVLLESGLEGPAEWRALWQAVRDGAGQVAVARAGDTMDLGDGVSLHVIYPPAGVCTEGSAQTNRCTLVLDLRYGAFSMLLMGDAEAEAEGWLLRQEVLQPTLALKVSHHGSGRATDADFLAATSPLEAVISVGPNRYGHPDAGVLARLSDAGVSTWRTDQVGSVELVTDGVSYSIRGR